tara:strand:+ start:82 stop:1155 length:1074 start_codon:yes stop_codon:yes gene_type:complete
VGTININHRRAFYHILRASDLGFGDQYSAGGIDITGNLVDVLKEVFSCREAVVSASKTLLRCLNRSRRPNHTQSHAQENIHHHYDVGNTFYKLWLDQEMQYTCAYFSDPELTLEQAQQAKMDHVCRKLQLKPGDRVIEAGCGWGGLSRHMALHYGVSVTAYNISREQLHYARQRAKSEGYDQQVTYVESDYRNIQGQCDAFASIGMLEHVGPVNYPALGDVMYQVLTEEGRGLIHTIGRNRPRPMSAWVDSRIFPGAYPPTLGEMMKVFEGHSFSVLDVENLRLHYAKTLTHWLTRYETANASVTEMFDDAFVRAWRLYLSSSIACFLSGGLQLFQVVFARGEKNAVPWSRQHLYTQ